MTEENGQGPEGMETEEGDAVELFPLGSLEGDQRTPQNYVRKGLPVEATVSLSRAEVPATGGLFDPDKRGRALVHFLPGTLHEIPQREGDDQRVKSYKVRQELRAVFVEPANDEASLIRVEFERLLELDPNRAAALRDELGAMVAEALQVA